MCKEDGEAKDLKNRLSKARGSFVRKVLQEDKADAL